MELKSTLSGWLEKASNFKPDTAHFLQNHYFHCHITGLEHIPSSGGVLLLANRSGWLPLDAAMLLQALRSLPRKSKAFLESGWLLSAMQTFLPDLDFQAGGPEEAWKELRNGSILALFPESQSSLKAKPFWSLPSLSPLGRGGFLKIALETESAILPVAIEGGEKAFPLLVKIPEFKLGSLRTPAIPITPFFPWFGFLGLFPLPAVQWKIQIGAPLSMPKAPKHAANDDWTLEEMMNDLRRRMETMLSIPSEAQPSPSDRRS